MQHEPVGLSPIQMKSLIYTKIIVELSTGFEGVDANWAPDFNLDGTEFLTEVSTAWPSDQAEDPRSFMVTLRFAILNTNTEKKQAPYTIDLYAQGWFELAPAIPISRRKDLVHVNGASMIFGSMRELVLQLTARSGFGPLTLPTLRFMPESSTPP